MLAIRTLTRLCLQITQPSRDLWCPLRNATAIRQCYQCGARQALQQRGCDRTECLASTSRACLVELTSTYLHESWQGRVLGRFSRDEGTTWGTLPHGHRSHDPVGKTRTIVCKCTKLRSMTASPNVAQPAPIILQTLNF